MSLGEVDSKLLEEGGITLGGVDSKLLEEGGNMFPLLGEVSKKFPSVEWVVDEAIKSVGNTMWSWGLSIGRFIL